MAHENVSGGTVWRDKHGQFEGNGFVSIDYSGIAELESAIRAFGAGADRVITSVLHGEGYKEIRNNIQLLIPSSGRSWKGKSPAASSVFPFRDKLPGSQLYVEVSTKTRYNYLYFPDDGSNTIKHAGDQHFAYRGAENSMDNVARLCVGKLTESFNK